MVEQARTQDKKSIKKLTNILFVVAIFIGLFFLLKDADFDKIYQIKNNVDWFVLLWALLLVVLNLVLMNLRWFILLKPVKNEISLRSVFTISINAVAINSASPGKLGVPTKAFLLKKIENVEVSKSIPSLFSEILLDNSIMLAFLIYIGIGGGYFANSWYFFRQLLISGAINVILILFVLALLLLLGYYFFKKKIKAKSFYESLSVSLKLSFSSTKYMSVALGVTVVNLLLSFWADLLLFKGLGVEIDYSFIVFSSSIATILGFLSPLPGGLGVRETSNTYLFDSYYNLGEIALITTVLRRVLTYVALLLIYFVMQNKALAIKVDFQEKNKNRAFVTIKKKGISIK